MNIDRKTVISAVIVIATLTVGGFLVASKKDSLFSKKDSSTTASVSSVQLKFTEKSFKLDYSTYSKDFVLNLANFEKNEDWQGNQDFDDVIFWEGDSSLLLSSKDNEKVDAYLNEKVDLSNYQIFKLGVYLQTDPSDVESVRLYFSNKDKTAYFSYAITNLTKGWNFLRIPKVKFSAFNAVREDIIKSKTAKKEASSAAEAKETVLLNWDKIERVGVELTSRSNSTTTANFDNLVSLESEDYMDDWFTGSPLFLDLVKTSDDRIVLQAKNYGTGTALVKKLSGVSNFTFKAKLQPVKINARSGLFLRGDYKTNYGYYFMIDGINGNRWQIFKVGLVDGRATIITLKSGVVSNFAVEKDKPLWLKVEAKGNNMKFHLSTDGKSFTQLGEINDSQFKEGGAGITVYDSGATQFDEFEFSQ